MPGSTLLAAGTTAAHACTLPLPRNLPPPRNDLPVVECIKGKSLMSVSKKHRDAVFLHVSPSAGTEWVKILAAYKKLKSLEPPARLFAGLLTAVSLPLVFSRNKNKP